MKIASIIINAVIFFATLFILIGCFRKGGQWQLQAGLRAFRYFTVLSNALCAASALAMALAQLRGEASPGLVTFKYVGTAAVSVTLLTVLLFLGPTMGYGDLLRRSNFYMHLAGPLLAIASYCFLEKREMPFATAMLGMIPVALYGLVYLYKVVLGPEEGRWEDFYGFNRGGKWPVAFAAMLAGGFVVCAALWLA